MPNQMYVDKIRLAIARYIHFILQLSGLFILLFLGLDLFSIMMRHGVSLSHSGRYFFLFLAVGAILIIIAGFWTRSVLGRQLVIKLMRIHESDIAELHQGSHYRFLGRLVLLSAYALVFVGFLVCKYDVIHLDAARYFTDTRGYLNTSAYAFSDIRFWFGSRSFIIPLLYKISGYSISNYWEQGAMDHVAQYQSVFSIISWTFLGISFSLGRKRHFSKIISFSVILFLGASIYVTQWDRVMLSESVSTSCMVLLLAFLTLMGILWDKHYSISVWSQAILLFFILFTAILFAFSRDTNAYFLLAFCGFMVIGLFFSSVRRHRFFRSYLIILVGFLVTFSLQSISMNLGRRYVGPLFHVVVYRIIPQQRSLEYFIAHGMPYDEHYLSLQSLSSHQLNDAHEESVLKLYYWVGDQGRGVIASYLLNHPLYMLTAPVNDVQQWVNSKYFLYRKILVQTPFRIQILSAIFYPHWYWLPVIFLVALLVCVGVIWKGCQRESIWFLVSILFLTAYPLVLLIWHSDPGELERHTFQVALQLRLASWMLIILLMEHGFHYYIRKRTKDGNPKSSTSNCY